MREVFNGANWSTHSTLDVESLRRNAGPSGGDSGTVWSKVKLGIGCRACDSLSAAAMILA